MSSAQASQLSQIMQGVNQGGGTPGVRGINDGQVLTGANTTNVGVAPPPPLGGPQPNPYAPSMSDMAAQNNFGMDGISVPFSGPKPQDFLKLRERFSNGIFGRMGGLLK